MTKKVLRVRMFAGPNGSGKSTLIRNLKEKINFGVYLNADEIEEEIRLRNYLDLDNFSLELNNSHWHAYIQNNPTILSKLQLNPETMLRIEQNILVVNQFEGISYIAAVISDFLRENLFAARKSFTFETVMSHPSKIEFISRLRQNGYRTYLYYIATESPDINIGRISARIKKGGHSVSPEKVKERYVRSLELLTEAVKATDSAYIFDNSGLEPIYIAEITGGKQIEMKTGFSPAWFKKSLLSNSH